MKTSMILRANMVLIFLCSKQARRNSACGINETFFQLTTRQWGSEYRAAKMEQLNSGHFSVWNFDGNSIKKPDIMSDLFSTNQFSLKFWKLNFLSTFQICGSETSQNLTICLIIRHSGLHFPSKHWNICIPYLLSPFKCPVFKSLLYKNCQSLYHRSF